METETNILYSTDHLDKIFTALSKAQGEFKVLEKNKDGFHGKYADLQSINDATLSQHFFYAFWYWNNCSRLGFSFHVVTVEINKPSLTLIPINLINP